VIPVSPALRGSLLALAAAFLFGASTPLLQVAGRGLGVFSTAALLYFGAALVGLVVVRPVQREANLRPSDLPRIATMALFGAALGPVALAWGLQRTSGASASLILTLEAVFTAVLARAVYGEATGRRVWAAMALLTTGGLILVLDRRPEGESQWQGLLAVACATAAWGLDNTLSRAVADRDPGRIVLAKSALGATISALLAVASGERLAGWQAALAILVIGATGYGLSLRLYLLAQRAFGAARTGSVFAFAPFVGAVLAVLLGDRSTTAGMLAGGAFMLLGVLLHVAESHAHEHVHSPIEHEHAHTHDDGHHTHAHNPMPVGPHSHLHRHEATRHVHPHVPDAHHVHRH
jgi:drug/metabolite transporter (DMT)-like permease